jgi:hypothetical protein
MQNDTPIPAELLAIGERLGFPTLETRSSDALDFREVAVWMVRDALRHAYEAGRRSAPPTRVTCPACGRDIEIRPLT